MAIHSGIYIHWPFCRSKCPYCDFFSKVQKNVPQNKLVDEYLEDIEYYADVADIKDIGSVFFGGGTPSLLSAYNVGRILDKIAKYWHLDKNAEISLEANPNTNHTGMFADLKAAGINRLSLGIQSLRQKELKFLGRTHSLEDALYSVEEVLRLFDNHSADVIYALPNQTEAEWQFELLELCNLGFRHLSLYQLTIEDGTIFAKKGILPADENVAAQLYELSNSLLSEHGYLGYEVSNYAQKGFECRHNKLYWQGDDYVGIGNGAHGRLHIGGKIFAVTHRRQLEKLTTQERAEELLLMGLRLKEGIDKRHFAECCGVAFDNVINQIALKSFVQQNLLENTERYLRATDAGILVLNKIIEELV